MQKFPLGTLYICVHDGPWGGFSESRTLESSSLQKKQSVSTVPLSHSASRRKSSTCLLENSRSTNLILAIERGATFGERETSRSGVHLEGLEGGEGEGGEEEEDE